MSAGAGDGAGGERGNSGKEEKCRQQILHALAFVFFIGGAVVGLATFWGTADYAGWLGAVIQMLSIWVYAAAYGGILLGLGEIIRLLDRE